MKRINIFLIILIIFFQTGNVLSKENIFNVNNIQLVNKHNSSYDELANQAIKIAFKKLINKILLDRDSSDLLNLNISEIKKLVSYYQVINNDEQENQISNRISFNVYFDRDKFHRLFFRLGVSYSEIFDKDLYLLPILKEDDKIFIFNQNFFYQSWNYNLENELIEFILPLESIELIQKINLSKDNLTGLDLRDLFLEYENKNLAIVLIEETNSKKVKIYLKTRIMGKNIEKNITVDRKTDNKENFYRKIILKVNNEIIDLVKSQNLIDIRTPSFLNTKLILNKKNNLVELNRRLEKIDSIDDLYVQEFNNEYVLLKIRYLGKLNKIIKQLEKQNIILSQTGDQWSLKII